MVMASVILGISVLTEWVTTAVTKSDARNRGIYLINAAGVDASERFRLVSRWGLK